ncbi:hypothetical protein ACQP1U_06600 [Actinomycetota bacterium]
MTTGEQMAVQRRTAGPGDEAGAADETTTRRWRLGHNAGIHRPRGQEVTDDGANAEFQRRCDEMSVLTGDRVSASGEDRFRPDGTFSSGGRGASAGW